MPALRSLVAVAGALGALSLAAIGLAAPASASPEVICPDNGLINANVALHDVNVQCNAAITSGTGLPGIIGLPLPHPIGLPWPHHHIPIPIGIPVGVLPGGSLSCAQLEASGAFPGFCRTGIPIGTFETINGVPCTFSGTSWVSEASIPVGTTWTVGGSPCHWTGGAWVPVPTPVTVPVPVGTGACGCATGTAFTLPAPVVTVPAPVAAAPAPAFASPVAPSQPALATGDGSALGAHS